MPHSRDSRLTGETASIRSWRGCRYTDDPLSGHSVQVAVLLRHLHDNGGGRQQESRGCHQRHRGRQSSRYSGRRQQYCGCQHLPHAQSEDLPAQAPKPRRPQLPPDNERKHPRWAASPAIREQAAWHRSQSQAPEQRLRGDAGTARHAHLNQLVGRPFRRHRSSPYVPEAAHATRSAVDPVRRAALVLRHAYRSREDAGPAPVRSSPMSRIN